MTQLRQRLGMIADSHGTVLISGESGAGKEVAARWIHEHSPRRDQPFLAINCAALSTSLLESELFGHEKGAFTGADKLRKGRFELADGGTLLLDEISEIAPAIQAKLLRVLQERSFERVGSSVGKSVDVRVIATTNRNLPVEVASGSFRQDLYFRLNVLPLHMPSLREHAEDIPALCGHFLLRVAEREGRPVKRLDAQAGVLLMRYAWPGNVRELQNICERAAVLTAGEVIAAGLLEPWLMHQLMPVPPAAAYTTTARSASTVEPRPDPMTADFAVPLPTAAQATGPEVVCDGQLTLEEIERRTILATLHHHQGHRQRSAMALGIGVRTLGLKLKKWKEQKLVEATL
jgi:two-component system, NtrC family, response regulator HydG